jgi:hypothetical protein
MSREEKKQIFIQNNKNKKIPTYQNSSKIQSENHRKCLHRYASTHIHAFSWLDTGASIASDGVEIV